MIYSWESKDNKYSIELNDETFEFNAFRYGDKWRNLSGDNLVYVLFNDNLALKKALNELASIFTDTGLIGESPGEFITALVDKQREG